MIISGSATAKLGRENGKRKIQFEVKQLLEASGGDETSFEKKPNLHKKEHHN
jgi:hypothetical protein